MRKVITLILFIIFGCSAGYDAQWEEVYDDIIIQVRNINPNIEMYYAEITLDSGSKIAIKLGKPNVEGIFRIKNTFGKFGQISIYTDSDLEEGE